MNGIRQIYYRGSLNFCNYSCPYCPFSKNRKTFRQLERDQAEWFRFVRKIEEDDFHGAIQIVPYGEALIHEYYWEGLAKLSRCSGVQAVGTQSNFSFPADKMLHIFEAFGGRKEKLRLWGTFHPDMTSVEAFLKQCSALQENGILFCVGGVGVPENLDVLKKLRRGLDDGIYMWLNKMDGLGRKYSADEVRAFLELDEYFAMELRHFPAEEKACAESLFVEGDGTIRPCNLCHKKRGNIYTNGLDDLPPKECTRTFCDCFLSYGSRTDRDELLFFQPYPAFRIPSYKKAVFFDVDGTLVPEGKGEISEETAHRLRRLARHSRLFLATSLPYETAMRKVKRAASVIEGGIFANGARVRVGEWEKLVPLEVSWLSQVEAKKREYGFRIKTYRKGNIVYKLTLTFPRKNSGVWCVPEEWEQDSSCQTVWEGNRMEITAAGTGKLEGLCLICGHIGVSFDEIAVFGNAENDIEMLSAVSFSVAAPGSGEAVKKAAGYVL